MPMAIPLLAAGASIFAGVTAVTAAGATMAAMVAGGAMIAGGAMTAIGAVTKNSRLMKIGGIASLAGGVIGLASGAWGSLVSEAATAPSSVESAIGGAAQEGLLAAEQGVAGAAAPVAQGATAGVGPGELAAPIADQGVAQAAQQGGIVQAAAPVPAGASPAQQALAQGPQAAFRAGELASQNALAPVAAPPTPGGWGQKIGEVANWMERNKALTQAGGGIVQGLASGYAQQAAVAEQMRLQREELARRRAELSASVIGLQMPTYVPPAPFAPKG